MQGRRNQGAEGGLPPLLSFRQFSLPYSRGADYVYHIDTTPLPYATSIVLKEFNLVFTKIIEL